ncbi:MAG: cytochrome c3 family protein [Candidatus Eisenbacteria bacterium]|uniref:Cytochrome c3 family protein n=1 Tax=Eiseniibacteriota bacterium TaxID=2212470 RepID=A0A948RV09_UNCEI|nr:cytochrome c3 family protein [Candidatus Eisenbacteria bacterium]MBU1949007.1 cytochrome c3 family protein [Candidatus Eisenbacteria bacterium]MBU2691520.1 cytochrome c3 family protein [Candidatus Eisenbacteria bacterium]
MKPFKIFKILGLLGVVYFAGFAVTGIRLEPDAQAQELAVEEDNYCFECHNDPTFLSDNEIGISLYVDPQSYSHSIHAGNGCVSCHQDVDPEDLPHESGLEPVDCGGCHDGVAKIYAASSHGMAHAQGDPDAPLCSDCHGKHDIRSSDDPSSITNISQIPRMCGSCHREDTDMVTRHDIDQSNVIQNYSMSIHGEGLFVRGLTVTAVCTSCHTAHNVLPHENPASTINRKNIAATCMKCHGRIEDVHLKVIRGELWEKEPHVIPSCVECHSPHDIRRVVYEDALNDGYCMGCHGSHDLVRTREGRTDTLFVDTSEILISAHGPHTPCVRCHVGVDIRLNPVCKDSGPVDCSICHAKEVESHSKSIHGRLKAEGDPNAPGCTDCHGEHKILPKENLDSPIFARNIPQLCANCHREGQKAAARLHASQTEVVEHYNMSIHGKGLNESGLMVTAMCTSCHTAHDIYPAKDPASSVNATNIAKTCAKCHLGIYEQFKKSIHSPEVSHTDKRLPVCYDCHQSHTIERVDGEDFRQIITTQCGQCHEEVTESYFETYHGKVSKLGYASTAKCSDCHGSHNILPPDDVKSTLSRANAVATCAKCHPESNRKFTGYLTHATHHDKAKYPLLHGTFWFMTILLVGTLGFFGIHTLLWIPRSFRERRRLNRQKRSGPEQQILRFEIFPRVLHIIVIISFIGLAMTGMILKFANQTWASGLARFLGGFESTGAIHRFCAVLTFAYFLLHFVHLHRKKKESGLSAWKFIFGSGSLLPNKTDLKEFWQTTLWFIGLAKRPRYGRWTYWEKFDYLAVFWGVAMIGFTGLMLWFPEFFTRFLPGRFINVATIIHSDEALLATGFIFSVHFFNTHFRPEKFPMDPVIFTGVVSLEELKNDRPREYEELVESRRLKTLEVPEPPRWLRIAARVFGFSALAFGLALIGLIIWSMLFQYR